MSLASLMGYSINSNSLLIKASDGASDYANKVGEPCIGGFLRYNSHFEKPILFTAGLGFIKNSHLFDKTVHQPISGDYVVKVGPPAFKIGFGGSLQSSVNNNSLNNDMTAIQRGDPYNGNKIIRFFEYLATMEKPIIKSMDVYRNAATEFLEGLSTGVIGIIVSSLGAIPFYGAIIDMGKAMNNAVEIVKDTSQLVKTSVETFQDVIDETKNNIDNMGDNLYLGGDINLTNKINTALSKKSDEVIQRTGNSIQQFELPFSKSKVN